MEGLVIEMTQNSIFQCDNKCVTRPEMRWDGWETRQDRRETRRDGNVRGNGAYLLFPIEIHWLICYQCSSRPCNLTC